ncbi:MAG: hypothetical protein SNF68_09030 [Rikenellaceae bacterium]
MKRFLSIIVMTCMLSACTNQQPKNSLQFILDGVHHNPGEAKTVSKYNDPEFLHSVGYNGITPHWHVQCALTYDSFEEGIIPEGSAEREWILAKQEEIRKELRRAKEAGLKVYPFTDMLVLPTIILEKYSEQIVKDDHSSGGSVLHGRMSPDIQKEMTQRLVEAQIREIFETFPELDGIVSRVGETYLFDTPYHSGSSPVGTSGDESRIARHAELLKLFRREICEKYDKQLFYRTWDFGFLHTRTDVFTKVMSQVEPHDNLCISIKYTKGDFHRLTQFNPTIGLGDHGYIVEVQGQPEYYGKGAHPVYIFGGMLNGFIEYEQNMSDEPYKSLLDLKKDPKFRGLWTWSRGGGWRGPYITNEMWCDVNAISTAVWAQDTTLNESQVLHRSLAIMGVEESSIEPFISILHKADEGVVKGQCSLIDFTEYNFTVYWARDQYISGEQSLSNYLKYIVNNDKGAEMMAEKEQAVVLWREIEQLSKSIRMQDAKDEEYLRVSSTYGRIKYELMREIFSIYYYGKLNEIKGVQMKNEMRAAIAAYDALWVEWRDFVAAHPDSATIYEPNAFKLGSISEGVSGNPKMGVAASVDKYRNW